MRVAACAVAVLLLAVAAASPVDAKPSKLFPETRKAVREMAHDTLIEADHTTAEMLREARRLVRETGDAAGGLLGPAPGLPALPTPPRNGQLEVRAVMTQPGFQGMDDVLAVLWIGASSGTWTGAYWLESDDGMVLPNLLEVGEEGLLLFMYGGSLSLDDSVEGARYRFLGIDGAMRSHALPDIPLLPGQPVLDKVSLAGADASTRGEAPEALLLAPWNTMPQDVTMGITLLSNGDTVEDFTIAGCQDPEASVTEAGCRLLYVLELTPDVTDLELWHLDATGARVVDETHDRLALQMGVSFAG